MQSISTSREKSIQAVYEEIIINLKLATGKLMNAQSIRSVASLCSSLRGASVAAIAASTGRSPAVRCIRRRIHLWGRYRHGWIAAAASKARCSLY